MVWMIWKIGLCTQLTASIQPSDWDELMLACPDQVEAIGMRNHRRSSSILLTLTNAI